MWKHKAVIFAGGRSSRMGKDKALLPFGGYGTLAEYQYKRMLKLFGEVYISAKNNKFDFDATIIADIYTHSSPLVALVSSLRYTEASEIFVLSVDMPFVDERLIARLYREYERGSDIEVVVAKSSQGIEPLCGIYSSNITDRALHAIQKGNHKLKDLLAICDTHEVSCDRDEMFVNLNTPNEYDRYTKEPTWNK